MRALVSADDVVAAVTDHLDHVHDAAWRLGCTGPATLAVTAHCADGLISDLLVRPETVGDLVGALYGRCREAAGRSEHATGPPAPAEGDPELHAVAAALTQLPERRRLGVLLLDAYGVTYAQAGVALGLDAAETARTVALGRAALVRTVDEREAAPLAGHDTAVGDLGMLSDGSAPAGGRFASLRRHVSTCATCAEMLGVQTRGKAMVGALPGLDVPDPDRRVVLADVRRRADAELPSTAQVQAELDGDVEEPPLISLALVTIALVLALVLGAALGALIGSRDGRRDVVGLGADQRDCSISATRNASSIDCPVFSRGSQAVS